MALAPDKLVDCYRDIAETRMRGLPIVNPALSVEAVGFDSLDDHLFGVLITPWFMNMVILPGNDAFAHLDPGASVGVELPAARYDFTTCRIEGIDDAFLSAVLFRTMSDFPDQGTARAVAEEILERLRTPPKPHKATVSRRSVLTGLEAR